METESGRGHDVPDEGPDERGPATMRDGPDVVDRIPVAVFVRCVALPDHPWLDERREVVAVLPAEHGPGRDEPVAGAAVTVHERPGESVLRYDGLAIEMHPDEAESYYFNLVAPDPQCFIVHRPDEAGTRVPFLVTLSFDLANSYAEGDDHVEAIVLDPSLYAPLEAFTLTWYVPHKRQKRRLNDWKAQP